MLNSPYMKRGLALFSLDRPELIFALLVLPVGLIMVFLTPPFQPMDEGNHFCRAYQLSYLQLLPEVRGRHAGGELPVSLIRAHEEFKYMYYRPAVKLRPGQVADVRSRPLEGDKTAYVNFHNTALYAPTVYLPHIPAIWLGRMLDLNPVTTLYLTRIFGLLCYVLLFYWVIRLTPIFKYVFLVVGCLPLAVHLGAAVNSDCIVLGSCFAYIALCLRLAEKEKLERRDKVTLAVLGIVVASAKLAYAPIVCLSALIPLGGKNQDGWRHLIRQWVVVGLVYASWVGVTLALHVQPRSDVNSASQIGYILSHPLSFLKTLFVTLSANPLQVLYAGVGALGHVDASITPLHFVLIAIVLVIAIVLDGDLNHSITRWQRWCLGVVAVANFFYLSMMIYVNSTKVGGTTIPDLGGRYFLPFLPAFLLLFFNHNYAKASPRPHRIAIICMLALSLILTLRTLYTRYYVT